MEFVRILIIGFIKVIILGFIGIATITLILLIFAGIWLKSRTVEALVFYYLHPLQVRKELKERKGQCNQCGECCRRLWRSAISKKLWNKNIKCPFLQDNNQCRIHKWRRYIPLMRPLCHFPIKSYPTMIEGCGYYYEEE